ncbi:hypothetical protein [Pseudomonas fluorescens]|uniref:hypothetical protein n=1 Tax=Pseudomonas fluorescens TaxID=294 RepID=UPI00372D59CB
MPLPSSINDLSTSAGSNSPAGSESPSTIDDYLRVYASYIAQLRDASQSNGFSMATAGGSANAVTATYSPAVVTVNDSTVLMFKATTANTGATTFSPNGITAAPVIGMNHAALLGGEWVAGSDVWLQWNSTIGGGSWMLLLSTGAAQVATTQAQFNNSTKIATTAFVQGVGLQFSGITGISANTTFTAAIAGGLVYSTNATPLNATLPLASAVPAKTTITFWNFGAGSLNLICSGSDGMYTNQIVTTYQLVMGTSVTLVSNGNSAWLVIGLQNATGVTGGFKNLAGSATGLSAVVTYTADELMVSNPAGFYQTLRSVSITPSLAASGVNGLDTGTSAVSTWYSVWVIWNGGTVAGLLSTSATSPTMPSGYTHKARVGWVRSDSTAGNKFPLSFVQSGRSVQYKVAAGSNVAAPIQMSSGTAGNPAANSWVAVSTSAFVCPTASRIFGSVSVSNGGAVVVAPNNAYSTMNAGLTDTGSMIGAGGSATAFIIAQSYALTLESANIYWASNLAVARLWCMGWEDNL